MPAALFFVSSRLRGESSSASNEPVLRELVDEIVTVRDAELIEAMKFFAGRMKMVVEPTGCLGLAAAFSGRVPVAGKKVGMILSGGNIDLMRFAELVRG